MSDAWFTLHDLQLIAGVWMVWGSGCLMGAAAMHLVRAWRARR